jgi:hypothetical protein
MENHSQLLEQIDAHLVSLDIGDADGIRKALERRGSIISSLPGATPLERLRQAHLNGQRIQQRLLLARALLRAELERLNTEASFLRAIVAQAAKAAGPETESRLF